MKRLSPSSQTKRGQNSQRGSVIIIVLWTSVLLTVLVTAMAAKVRLSAKTAFHNQEAVLQWSDVMAALNQAQMQLMLERMPQPIGVEVEETDEGEIRNTAYKFNGQLLQLHYLQAEQISVRIYDHAGKINLNRIPRRNMQLLIEKRLGGQDADPEEVQDLLAAWTDWVDLNDLEGINGAEADYYQSLDQPFSPRNNSELDTVEEILHIRGFADLFEGVNLDAAFTIYGNARAVNMNLATREAMQLLPGMDDELVEIVIAYREIEDIRNQAELAEIIPFENFQELAAWTGTSTSNIYSVFVYPKIDPQAAGRTSDVDEDGYPLNPDPVTRAYMQIIEVTGFNNLPTVYQVAPYGHLPDTAPARIEQYDIAF
ncbi:MAG: hypothetical protein COC19_03110 [SAR86 cluster bacterium]|uniref:T2SS protein K first SAM-like domain-containing protein n=1 Tax=SAR86 cluster bacterium TaxID=2030880 RepID=A0A2A4MQW7_9GAMM|nr:MAG: hypothetical protein COC19_03110 [SAR86 cluster bacterium]